MNTKFIVLMTLLIMATCDTTVNKADACNACTQFKSQSDCVTFGCAWTAATATAPGSCAKATVAEVIAYCPGLADQTKCWSTYGCAFVDGKCTTFAGCSAYVKTTTADCQAISYLCITNGTTCTDALTCDKYTATQCPSTPDLNGRGCKVDDTSGNCRNFNCSEAGETKTTNELCGAFSAGCLTTGAGCVANPVPACSILTGTETTCLQMRGSDGRCKFGSGTNCAYKPCTDAPNNLVTVADCKAFQDNCVTTGKGCIDKLGACSSYTSAECAGLIGTDNYCEQDGATTCKAKKCENATFTTPDACAQYQIGCLTNGKQCVTILGNCATYTGTTSECQKIAAKDGNCTGSSPTTSGPCKPKECTEATSSYKTDTQCQAIQSYCKTTGTGCISSSSIASCTSYTATRDDGSDCADLYGKEGKCIYSGSAKKCKAKVCKDAPVTNTTNQACNQYQTDCVTNGAGCQDQTSCFATVKQATCQGTKENSAYCNWNAICVSNTLCSNLPTPAICAANKAKDGTQCIWNSSSNKCRNAVCKDYTATTDSGCIALMTGCVTNGTICADPSDCAQFQGIKTTCEGYNAKCTQLSTVTTATTACISRSCANASTDYNTDSDCQNYLGTCLTDGSGCIESNKDCTFYTGTATTCPNFQGYVSTTSRVQCWSDSTADAPCVQRQCSNATSMGSDADCESFKSGCLYNGKGSCVTKSAYCNSYGYTTDDTSCQNFLGNVTTKCWKAGSGSCRDRVCGDYTGSSPSNSDCDGFLTDCITDGTNCVHKSTVCTSFSGTVDQCNGFTGNGKQCTKMTTCKSKTCADKTDAANNAACVSYHQKCRLIQGGQICQDAKPICSYYTFAVSATNPEKQAYCGAISTTSKSLCAYDTATTANCVARTSCSQWSTDIGGGVTCADYMGTASCIENTTVCYTLGACTSYVYPSSITVNSNRSTWCAAMTNSAGDACTYVNDAAACSSIVAAATPTTCEGITAPTDAAECNTTLVSVNCQYNTQSTKCYTTKAACTEYLLTSVATGDKTDYCAASNQDNSGFVIKCKYDSATSTDHCIPIVCSEVTTGATNQAYCDAVSSGCKFYAGGCYEKKACTSYAIPSTITGDPAIRIFCQNMYNAATQDYCSFTDGESTCTAPIAACTDFTLTSTDDCGLNRYKTGAACNFVASASTCSNPIADVCSAVTAINADSCDIYTTVGSCYNVSNNCVVRQAACTGYSYTSSTDAGTKSADCQKFADLSGNYCSWISSTTGTQCETAPTTCAGWASLTTTTDNTTFCKARKDKSGNGCTYDQGASTCRTLLACESATTPKSQADCDKASTGCTYFSGTCIVSAASCGAYTAVGGTEPLKFTYCGGLKNSSNVACTFLKGLTFCVNKSSTCTSYSLTGLSASDKTTACAAVGCTYWLGTTGTCVAIQACSGYTGGTASSIATDCTAQKDTNGKTCFGATSATACSQFANCEAITGAASLSDCNKYIAGCIYNSNKCYTKADNCAYTVSGTGSLALCAGFTNSANSDLCTASSDTATNCQPRTCSDSNITTPTTNAGCSTYKSSCKSNGTSCIDGNLACASYSATTCTSAFDADNVSTCIAFASTCINKDCTLNVTATTDGECTSFRSGCLTNGAGCVESTVPCSEYVGTQSICSNFTGNSKKCWGNSSTVSDYCRDRACKDNSTATKDSECEEFLSGCVTTGAGCVPKTSPCSAYKGNQATCEGFTETAGKCWNTSTAAATASCLSRECTLFTGTTDPACAAFMPSTTSTPKCVTNGKACVPSSTKCSGFKGTYLTCPNFLAQDGPCKAASISTTEAACVQRVCTDAPNNFTTDLQCSAYHSSCVTTGRGCIASTSCDSIQTQTACGARTGCLWANQCRAAPIDCDSLSTSGQSICTNTLLSDGTTKCAWSASTNKCRKFTCVDYDATFTTHKSCNDQGDKLCTTSGAGCVNYSSCGSYTSQSVCNAASTTEDSKRCTWDVKTAKCRPRECTDFEGTTNEDCDGFLAGCKTTGKACVGPKFDCSAFQLQKLCLQDGNKLPCVWVNGTCYNYANCTNATTTLTLDGCKAFNPLCVPSETNCIAQSSCDLYKSSTECKIGIGATTCGWLPSGKCQVFGACSDATGGSTDSACQLYGSTCMTDGTNCVAKGNCSTYLTSTACESTNWGTDGQCKWVASGTSGSCRLAVCTDKTATTDADCVAFTVASGKCTTDGTTCVARAACTTYNSEAACQVGSDGIPCTYNYPVGTTTGTKSCRAKECADIKGTSNDQCIGQIAGKNCVSNGKNCVKQDTCASYTNKLSCNGGGTDGVCAFSAAPTTADPLAGTCTQFSSCDKANKDQSACSTKSAACHWISTTAGTTTTTSCTAKTCVQAASGTTCNYIPSFDGTKYTICNLVNNACTASDPSTLAQTTCYSKSAYTYTWNESTSKCVSCTGSTSTTNNSTSGNTTNQTNNTTTDTNGYILGVTIPIVILGFFA